uniref:Neur_chan_LBD domain-containing protein n=1 Tax=Steinernema glaseri TaxID=37863 RepID=A0A1I8AIF5_9BILA
MLLLYTALIITASRDVLSAQKEKELYELLLDDYQPLERPVERSEDPVVVRMGLTLQQILDVNEKEQHVELNAWLKLSWYDYNMQWDPEDFDGISDLRFRKEFLWTPDILLYNSASEEFDKKFASNIVVYSNGTVNWIPPGVFKLSCVINIVWFPWDQQHCTLKFGSWTYDGYKLELQIDEIGLDTSTYMDNGEWSIEGVTLLLIEINADVLHGVCRYICGKKYSTLFFNLIVPCILITILTLIGFSEPPDAGEKMSLQITVMLSICIFQNYVMDLSPPTSNSICLLGTFFMVCMCTVAFSVTFSVIILNFHQRSPKTHEMSQWMRLIFLHWLPWLLMMKRPGYLLQKNEPLYPSLAYQFHKKPQLPPREPLTKLVLPDNISQERLAQLLLLENTLNYLVKMNEQVNEEYQEQEIEREWKFAALVLDRLSMFATTFFISVVMISLFLSVVF